MKQTQFQRCPNCRERNDVSVYVQGQLTRCVRCSIRFTVDRQLATPEPGDTPAAGVRAHLDSPTDVSMMRNGALPPAPPLPSPSPPPALITSGQLFPTPAERPHAAARKAEPEPRTSDGKPVIPGYECVELLGRGGMGEVWRARQVSLDRPVAVKILSPTLAVEPDFIRRFERESTALAALAHPHVVAVYDRGSANGHWYFVMEHVEGASLRDRVSDRKVARAELFRLLAQVARAMEYAHKKGVIHRDLKPENVLIDHVGNAKVADFGLAGMIEAGRSSLTMTAVAMGTAHYMAPEQRRDAKNVDGRADLYSLGIMLYEMLCAEVPAGRFPSPREKVPDLDPQLDVMIMRMLDQDPERRPSAATEVAELLERLSTSPTQLEQVLPRPAARTQSWSAVVRDIRSFSFAQKSMLVGSAVLFVLIVAVAIVEGGPPARSRYLPAKIDTKAGTGNLRIAQVAIGAPGATDAILAVGAGWNLQKSDLVRDVEPAAAPGDRVPRAYVMPIRAAMENASVEADVTLEGIVPTATGDKAAAAEILFYRDHDRNIGVRLVPTDDASATLFARPAAKAKVLPAPAEAHDKSLLKIRKYHVELQVTGRSATALVDHKPVATAQLTGFTGLHGKLAFACRNVRCRFSNVRLSGLLVDVPPRTAAP